MMKEYNEYPCTLRVDAPSLNILPHLLFFFLLNHFKVKGARIFQYSPPAFFFVTSVPLSDLRKLTVIPEFCLRFILNYPFIIYVFLFLAVLGLRCRAGLLSLVAVHGLRIAVASLVAEHGL